MNSRTASRVTAPDLTKAFDEGRGADLEEKTSSVWVVLCAGVDAKRATQYPLAQLGVAMIDVEVWLRCTLEGAAILFTGVEAPDIYGDAVAAISAAKE